MCGLCVFRFVFCRDCYTKESSAVEWSTCEQDTILWPFQLPKPPPKRKPALQPKCRPKRKNLSSTSRVSTRPMRRPAWDKLEFWAHPLSARQSRALKRRARVACSAAKKCAPCPSRSTTWCVAAATAPTADDAWPHYSCPTKAPKSWSPMSRLTPFPTTPRLNFKEAPDIEYSMCGSNRLTNGRAVFP